MPLLTEAKVNARAAQIAAQSAGFNITGLSKADLSAVQSILSQALYDGWSEPKTQLRIRQVVGLSKRDAVAVANYRSRLMKDGASSLSADKSADKYADRLRKRRAEVIADYELRKAQHEARRELWEEARNDGRISPYAVRVWKTHKDERTCPVCRPLNGRRTSVVKGAYATGGGEVLTPPAHPNCRCTEVLKIGNRIIKDAPEPTTAQIIKHLPGNKADGGVRKHLPGLHDQRKHAGWLKYLRAKLAESDGFSVHRRTGMEPATGYMVATPDAERIFKNVDELTTKDITDYLKEFKHLLDQDDFYFGAWFDKDDTKWLFFDVSFQTESQSTARKKGNEYGQLAYFDLNVGETVPLRRYEGGDVSKAKKRQMVYIPLDKNAPPAAILREIQIAVRMLGKPVSKARDGDGDGFVHDGTPRMRPAIPKLPKQRRIATSPLAGRSSKPPTDRSSTKRPVVRPVVRRESRRHGPVQTGLLDLTNEEDNVEITRNRLIGELGEDAVNELGEAAVRMQALLDVEVFMEETLRNPNDRRVTYKVGDHPTKTQISRAAERSRRNIAGSYELLTEGEGELSDGEVVKNAIDIVRSEIGSSTPSMMITPQILLTVMEGDGVLKNQFETGKSRGWFDHALRADIESNWGPPANMPGHKRPVYGFAARADEYEANEDAFTVMQYGDLQLSFKKNVMDRATLTVGDSLTNDVYAIPVSELEDAPDNRVLAAFDGHAEQRITAEVVMMEDDSGFNYGRRDFYYELQYHGGVTADDVESVLIHNDASFELLELGQSNDEILKAIEDLDESEMQPIYSLVKLFEKKGIEWFIGDLSEEW